MTNMLNIVLFGPPGAGKGTQSQKLINKYSLTHLSTGDILRSEIARGTALGMEAKQLMDRGDLVGDDIVIAMIESKIDAEPHAKGFIFDGFPRTQAQAVALDDLLQKKGTAICAMLALEVNNEELVKRLLLRGKESGRADDQNEEIIRNRVNEYNNKTLPLKQYYSEQAKYHSINGIGSVDSIFNELCERITFVKAEIELTMLENDIEHLDLTINDFEVATEISEELKHDIAEVRKTDNKKAATPKTKVILVKKPATNTSSVTKKKIVTKKTSTSPIIKKKTVAKKTVKKAVAKKAVAKKTTKKVAPKKAVKIAPKKLLKKSATKKTIKNATTKKVVAKKVAKKIVAKKPIKKASRPGVTKKVVKKITPKKTIKSMPKKVMTKNTSTSSVTKKKTSKRPVAKKIVKKKK